MLRFVFGESGYGKSHYIQHLIAGLAESGKRPLMVIIPDQSSFDTEKAFLDLLGPKLSSEVKIVGFSRLCDFVHSTIGHLAGQPIDEGGRHLIMSLAVEQVQDFLTIYKKHIKSKGFVDLLLQSEKEFKKSAISTTLLREKAEKAEDKLLAEKLKEAALICDAFEGILCKSFIDPYDKLTQLVRIFKTEKIFSGYTIAVDGFSGFTYQEINVLEQLLIQSEDFYLSLSCGVQSDCAERTKRDALEQLFSVTETTAKQFRRIAENAEIEIAAPVYLDYPYRYKNGFLIFLEKNIFRMHYEKSGETPQKIKLYEASNIYGEVDFVAKNLCKLAMNDGFRWKDMAIICRGTEPYKGVLDTALDKYNIPYFMDRPENIQSKTLMELVKACCQAVISNFDAEDILAVLKTGLTDVAFEDVIVFENYLLLWEISGRLIAEPFTRHPRGFTETFTEDDAVLLNRIEEIRIKIITPLLQFKTSVKNADGAFITKALYALLLQLNAGEHLTALADELESKNDLVQAQEQLRTWELLMDIFDKTADILKDYRIPMTQYLELLKVQFQNEEISTIPAGMDQVTVGTADRVRLNDKKVVFVIGAVNGQFPVMSSEIGIFNNYERQKLMSMDLPINDLTEAWMGQELFFAYCALTAASDHLFVTWYGSDLSGDRKTPSMIVAEIVKIFPNIIIEKEKARQFEDIWCEKTAFEYLCEHFTDTSLEIKELTDYFFQHEAYKSKLLSLRRSLEKSVFLIEDKKTAVNLFGEKLKFSASQIEKYHLCKFQYFCRYGLKLNERKAAKLDPLEYGMLVHYMLEQFFQEREHDASPISENQESVKEETVNNSFKPNFPKANDKEAIENRLDILFDEYAEKRLGGLEDKTERFKYLYLRIKKTLYQLLVRILEEMEQTSFIPVDFELKIGEDIPSYTVPVSPEHKVLVVGKADRVDVMKKDGVSYIRVVDYKTGSKDFNLYEILYGLNLQMFIYLNAINRSNVRRYGENTVPAGVLYMPSTVSAVFVKIGDTPEKILENIQKESRMSGLILQDMDVIKGMDSSGAGTYIPVILKEGEVNKGFNHLVTLEEMGAIFKKIDTLICEMAQSLLSGNIDNTPVKGICNGCNWCPYISICRYRKGMKFLHTVKKDKTEVMEELSLQKG